MKVKELNTNKASADAKNLYTVLMAKKFGNKDDIKVGKKSPHLVLMTACIDNLENKKSIKTFLHYANVKESLANPPLDKMANCLAAIEQSALDLKEAELNKLVSFTDIQLDNLTSLIEALPLSSKGVNTIIKKKHILNNDPKILIESLQVMQDKGLAFTPLLGQDNLKRLLELDKNQLKNFHTLLTDSRADNKGYQLNGSAIGVLLKPENKRHLSDNDNKFTALSHCLANMDISKVSLTRFKGKGNLQKLLEMDKETLAAFSHILNPQIDNSSLEILIKNKDTISPLKEPALKSMGDWIELLKDNDLSLTQKFPNGNLNKLLQLSSAHLEALGTVEIEKLSQSVFDVLVNKKNEKNLTNTDGKSLATCLKLMAERSIPLTTLIGNGNLQDLLEIGKPKQKLLATLLEIKNIDKSAFPILTKHFASIQEKDLPDLNHLNAVIETITQKGLPLTTVLRGTVGNLHRLLQVKPDNYEGLNHILKNIPRKDLDEPLFKILTAPGVDYNDKEQNKTLGLCLNKILSNNIPIRTLTNEPDVIQQLLTLRHPKQKEKFTKFAKVLEGLHDNGKLNKTSLQVLLKNFDKLSSFQNQEGAIVDCVNLLSRNGASLTTIDRTPGNLSKLLNMESEQLVLAKECLEELDSFAYLDKKSADFVLGLKKEQLEKLKATIDKNDDGTLSWEEMKAAAQIRQVKPAKIEMEGKKEEKVDPLLRNKEAGAAQQNLKKGEPLHEEPLIKANEKERFPQFAKVLKGLHDSGELNKKSLEILSDNINTLPSFHEEKVIIECVNLFSKKESSLITGDSTPDNLIKLLNMDQNKFYLAKVCLEELGCFGYLNKDNANFVLELNEEQLKNLQTKMTDAENTPTWEEIEAAAQQNTVLKKEEPAKKTGAVQVKLKGADEKEDMKKPEAQKKEPGDKSAQAENIAGKKNEPSQRMSLSATNIKALAASQHALQSDLQIIKQQGMEAKAKAAELAEKNQAHQETTPGSKT